MQALDGKDAQPDADSRRVLRKRHGCERTTAGASARPLGRDAERPFASISAPARLNVRSPPARRTYVMSNLVHNEQVKLAATFWNNLGVAALLGVFLVPAFYTRHTALQQALSIGVGLAAAIALRMVAHWWLTRLRE